MTPEELNTLVSVGNIIAKNLYIKDDAVNWANFKCVQASEYHDNYGEQGIQLVFTEADPNADKLKKAISRELVKAGYEGIEIILEW
jgi:hypothetical protein